MEHFYEEIAQLRQCYIKWNKWEDWGVANTNLHIRVSLSNPQGNVPLRHLVNAEPPFIFWQEICL